MKAFFKGHELDRTRRVRLPLYVYLSYLLVATFLFTGISFSKYATTVSIQDNARVAAFSVNIDGKAAAALVLDASNETLSSNSYSFSVSSNSEVLVADIVTVTLPDELPAGIYLTMTVNSAEVISEINGSTYKFVKNFAYGEDFHLWTLTFTADQNVLEIVDIFELNNISIHVDAMQIDGGESL